MMYYSIRNNLKKKHWSQNVHIFFPENFHDLSQYTFLGKVTKFHLNWANISKVIDTKPRGGGAHCAPQAKYGLNQDTLRTLLIAIIILTLLGTKFRISLVS